MSEPNIRAQLVSLVAPDGDDQGASILNRLDTIVALLAEIRDDQRAAQGSTSEGVVVKTKAISVSLL